MLAWLTPDTSQLLEGKVSRSLCIPYPLLMYVSGALRLLCEENRWESYGDMSPGDISDYFKDIFDEWMSSNMSYVGQIGSFLVIPDCWLELDGSSVLRADYPELEAVVPASWLTVSQINLPNMAGYGLIGQGSNFGNVYNLGDIGGEESHALTEEEIPIHNHDYDSNKTTVGLESPAGIPTTQAAGLSTPDKTGSAGGGESHNNMPPFLVVKMAIFSGR